MNSPEPDQKQDELKTDGPCRIVFGITELDPGGAERALVQLVTRLDRSRWEPHVFCLSEEGALTEPLIQANIPVTCFGVKNIRDLMVIRRVSKYLKTINPQILQTYLYHANIIGRVAGRLAGVKSIFAGIRVAEKRSRFPLWIDRLTDRMVDMHVCVSQDVADFTHQNGNIAKSKLMVIPNGVDAEHFADAPCANLQEFNIPPDATTAIVVGRLDRQKGPTILLEAFKNLLPHHQELHLLFVGSGPLEEELKNSVRKNEMEKQIHFAGWRQDIPELMKASSFLILPSRWEGMPNVVLEAMASGLPVISTRVEGVSELVSDNETGLLVPIDNPKALSEKIEFLLKTPSKAEEMGNKAQTVVSQSFTWDHVVSQYENLYFSHLNK